MISYSKRKQRAGANIQLLLNASFTVEVWVCILSESTGLLNFAKNSGLADHAILVSSAGFTKDAYLVSEAAGIDLVEIEALTSAISKKKEQEKANLLMVVMIKMQQHLFS